MNQIEGEKSTFLLDVRLRLRGQTLKNFVDLSVHLKNETILADFTISNHGYGAHTDIVNYLHKAA